MWCLHGFHLPADYGVISKNDSLTIICSARRRGAKEVTTGVHYHPACRA